MAYVWASADSPLGPSRGQALSRAWASRVASAGSSAARASQAAPPTPLRARRTGPANRAGSSLRRVDPTGEVSPVRLPARTIGVVSAGSRIRPRVASSAAAARFDDQPCLRVAVPVGGADQRGQRRQLNAGTRVHRLDHPVAPPVNLAPSRRRPDLVTGPVRVQLAEHGADQATRRLPRVERVQGGTDGLAPQPEPRAVVAEEPAVAVGRPGQPVADHRAGRRAGAGDQHRAVGVGCPGRERDLEVGRVPGVAGQARVRPDLPEPRGHRRCPQRRSPGDADHRRLHPSQGRPRSAPLGGRGRGPRPPRRGG